MKHAVIYVPGAAQHLFGQSGEVMGERLAHALRTNRPGIKDVRLGLSKNTLDLGSCHADCIHMEGLIGDAWQPVMDVYEVNYLPAFVGQFVARSPIERAFNAIRVFSGQVRQIPQVLSRESKCFRDNLQGFLMMGLMLLLTGYLIYWVFVAFTGVFALEALTRKDSTATETATLLAAAAGALTLVRFSISSLLGKLERSAIELFALCKYIKDDSGFHDCHEPIRAAIVALRREGYERVDMVSFSMGCLISGDAIFPRRVTLRATADAIDRWVTIGYPYDLVRAIYPKYFDDRRVAVTFERWWNVTEHDDFLGSNFRRDTDHDEPDPGVGFGHDGVCTAPHRNLYYEPPVGGDRHARIKARSMADWIPLRRLQNHGVYWNPDDKLARSCFGALVADGFFDTAPPRQPAKVAEKAPAKAKRPARRETALADRRGRAAGDDRTLALS